MRLGRSKPVPVGTARETLTPSVISKGTPLEIEVMLLTCQSSNKALASLDLTMWLKGLS
jgi:hypothetical protein